MKIVVLDGYTANPGDLSWEALQELGELEVFDGTDPDLIVQRASGAEVLVTNKLQLNHSHFSRLPSLRCICLLATGYDNIHLGDAKKAGIHVYNAKNYSSDSVAQHVFALLFHISNRVDMHSTSVREGKWYAENWSYTLSTMTEWSGKNLGLVGFGKIAQRVARIGSGLGMKLSVYSRTEKKLDGVAINWLSFEELLKESDVLSLHIPLSEATKKIINSDSLGNIKRGAILINTARGALVDEEALKMALADGQISWALLDVVSEEPPCQENVLFSLPNCIVTPHQAWATKESRARLISITAGNIRKYLAKDYSSSLI